MEDTNNIFNEVGRPPTYKDPVDIQEKVNEYFENVVSEDVKPTVTGLALYLGFASRQSFYDYERKPKFSYTIKRARLAIENVYENRLHLPGPTGAIFALKNMGWKDSVQHDTTEATQEALKDFDTLVKKQAKLLE